MIQKLNYFKFVCAFILGLSGTIQGANAAETSALVRVQLKSYHTNLKEIQRKGLDVAGVDLDRKKVDLIVSESEYNWLKSRGWSIQVVRSSKDFKGPDSQYQNPSKIENTLKQVAARYPNLARVGSIGKSLQGRDIWAIQISEDVGSKKNVTKPHVFFNSMHHAREVMTSEVALDIIEQLLTGYGKDKDITQWLKNYVIDVVPMFNVDGNNQVWTADSMWRKNVRGGYGVDINRNYPFAWNSCRGSSSSKNAQDYHGESAGSEPETQVMMEFVKKIRPVFSISYHSYSEIVIYPYGCEGQRTQTKAVVEKIGQELASKIVKDDGRGKYKAGTAPELLYSVDGGDIDWLYGVAQTIPYVIEVNSSAQGFQPSYSKWRDSTVERNRAGWKYLLSRMDGASIYGQVSRPARFKSESLVLQIRGQDGFSQDYRVHPNGFFNVILNPGKYTITPVAGSKKLVKNSTEVDLKDVRTEVTISL